MEACVWAKKLRGALGCCMAWSPNLLHRALGCYQLRPSARRTEVAKIATSGLDAKL